jgi:hypothetical protein
MAAWTGEPIPEREPDWRWLDHAIIIAAFVIIVAIGIFAAGGPN